MTDFEIGREHYLRKEYKDAIKWFTIGAGKGSCSCMNWLGQCYEYGLGTEKDLVKAKDLYFVVAYYKNSFKELADVEFITTPFNGTLTNGEYEFEHTFKTVEGADSIRFMMWDGFDTLLPLSSSVFVK